MSPPVDQVGQRSDQRKISLLLYYVCGVFASPIYLVFSQDHYVNEIIVLILVAAVDALALGLIFLGNRKFFYSNALGRQLVYIGAFSSLAFFAAILMAQEIHLSERINEPNFGIPALAGATFIDGKVTKFGLYLILFQAIAIALCVMIPRELIHFIWRKFSHGPLQH